MEEAESSDDNKDALGTGLDEAASDEESDQLQTPAKGRGRGKGTGKGKGRGSKKAEVGGKGGKRNKTSTAIDPPLASAATDVDREVSGKGARKKGGRPSATVGGQKYCAGCGKWLDLFRFPASSKWCDEDKPVAQNLISGAALQGETEWVDEVLKCPKTTKRVFAKIKRMYPKVPGKNRPLPMVVQLDEELREEEQLLIDGVFQMMNVKALQVFRAKPQNGGFEYDDSKAEFLRLHNDPETVTDEKGPTKELKDRVAFRVKDLVTERDLSSRGQILRVTGASKKKATQDDVLKMQTEMASKGMTTLKRKSRAETAMDMNTAKRLKGSDGSFSFAGKFSAQMGSIADLKTEEEEAGGPLLADEYADDDVSVGGTKDGTQSTKSSKASNAAKEPWFDVDDTITIELSKHSTYMTDTRRKYTELVQSMEEAESKCSNAEVYALVVNEHKLFTNRMCAAKLVSGNYGRRGALAPGNSKDGSAAKESWDVCQ